jgi:hypothetical protein
MNDDNFNMSIRKFLKMVGVRSQHEIELAIAKALASGQLKGNETVPAKMTLTIGKAHLNVSFDGVIELE